MAGNQLKGRCVAGKQLEDGRTLSRLQDPEGVHTYRNTDGDAPPRGLFATPTSMPQLSSATGGMGLEHLCLPLPPSPPAPPLPPPRRLLYCSTTALSLPEC
jgi:hypothetical protein